MNIAAVSALALPLAAGCALVSDGDLAGRMDLDKDGFERPADCDDGDASVTTVTWYLDGDGDGYGVDGATLTACVQPAGYAAVPGDCDDADAGTSPGISFFWDGDGDDYGDAAYPYPSCEYEMARSLVTDDTDCDDRRADVHPGAEEVCDAADVDEDCDGLADDEDWVSDGNTWYADRDMDGFGAQTDTTSACEPPSGYLDNRQDCDDADADVTTECRWVEVSAGYDHACARRGDGRVSCWGEDETGLATEPDGDFVNVSAGYQASCGVLVGGALSCWGEDSAELLVDAPAGPWTEVSVGQRYACALTMEGEIMCWGDVPDGASPPEGTGFTSITTAEHAACAMNESGGLAGWYADDNWGEYTFIVVDVDASDFECYGLTADGYIVSGDTLSWDMSDPIVAFTEGPAHDCVLHADGAAECGGSNDYGQGDVPEGAYSQLSAGSSQTCAITTDGFLTCWGSLEMGIPTD